MKCGVYMEYDSIKKIKKEALFSLIEYSFRGLFWAIIVISMIVGLFSKMDVFSKMFLGFFTLLCLSGFLNALSIIIKNFRELKKPQKNSRFLRYGTPDMINEILYNLDENSVYSDDKIVIDNKYIMIKKSLNSLCALEDIVGVYKFVLRTNLAKTNYGLKYHDKYGKEYVVSYSYRWSDVDIDNILYCLYPRCVNAKFGYNDETLNYVKSNIKKEPRKFRIRESKDIVSEFINNNIEEKYDEDLKETYDNSKNKDNFEDCDDKVQHNKIDENDDFFKEDFEFSYAKVKEVLKKIGFESYATFKKHVYETKKIERKKFDNKEKEIDYLVQAVGYENFEDFYNTNMEVE